MDPENVARWEDRITKPMAKLQEMGHFSTAINELEATYQRDLGDGGNGAVGVGLQYESSSQEEEEEEEGEAADKGGQDGK